MKSLYQTTLEQFTGTQELKEGDYVVCPMYPNESFELYINQHLKNLEIRTRDIVIPLANSGKIYEIEEFPIFLKCPPPKKKVEKVFEVYVDRCFIHEINDEHTIYSLSRHIHNFNKKPIKAKLIVEVEE
jgi:hypothetical protein